MNVPFEIKDIRLLSLQYSRVKEQALRDEVKGEAENQEINIPVEFVCSSNYQNEKRLLEVIIGATIKGPIVGFSLTAEIGGAFLLQEDPAEDILERLRHVQCPAILFPYLREIISEVSKRAGFDPFFLPPVNFIRMYESSRQKAEIQDTPDCSRN